MALSSTDLTLYTFTRNDKIGSSMFYKTCESSWKKAYPGAKIIKFNMDELIAEYSDVWWYDYINTFIHKRDCYYTDFLRVVKAMEIPNSIYLDSDIYLLDSALPAINRALDNGINFIGKCYYFFNNGITPEIQKLYDFYTGKHDPKTSLLIKRTPGLINDSGVWNALRMWPATRDFGGEAHFFSFGCCSQNLIVPCKIIDPRTNYGFEYNEIAHMHTLILFDPSYPHFINTAGKSVYITNDINRFRALIEDFLARRELVASFTEVSLKQLLGKYIKNYNRNKLYSLAANPS